MHGFGAPAPAAIKKLSIVVNITVEYGICLQEMKVITPPGDYVGRVQQRCTWMVPVFHVRDAAEQVLFIIEGPAVLQRSALMLAEFKVQHSTVAS